LEHAKEKSQRKIPKERESMNFEETTPEEEIARAEFWNDFEQEERLLSTIKEGF